MGGTLTIRHGWSEAVEYCFGVESVIVEGIVPGTLLGV